MKKSLLAAAFLSLFLTACPSEKKEEAAPKTTSEVVVSDVTVSDVTVSETTTPAQGATSDVSGATSSEASAVVTVETKEEVKTEEKK